MNLLTSLIALLILTLLALGIAFSAGLAYLLTVIIPYAAFAVFLAGFVYRVVKWASAPVPFRITTTCGQEKSLPWIRTNPLENPSGLWGVIGRMALEVFLFRSLFRNTEGRHRAKARLRQRQMALVFRASLPLVAVDHRA